MKNIVFLLKLADGYMTILSNIFLITTVIVNLYWKRYVTWSSGVVFITTAQLYSTKAELRFWTSSNPAHVSKTRGDEDL